MTGTPFQRSLILIGGALALPLILLVVLQVLFVLGRERDDVKNEALARAEQIVMLADARIAEDFSAMRVLATAPSLRDRDWRAAFSRARDVSALNPHWRNVIVSDLQTRREVFDLRRGYYPRGIAPPAPVAAAMQPGTPQPFVDGAYRDGPGCPCTYLHMPLPNGSAAPRFLLSVAIDPSIFQSALLERTPRDTVSAIADRNGNFIARNIDFEARVGTPATEYVRTAVASGELSGLYSGRTLEGFQNYTTFYRSPVSGWTAHIAVASSLLDRPQVLSYVTLVLGALFAIALAAGFVFYVFRDLEQRRNAEARLAQAQKLEAIGQLTGGVAHDFNNLLTVMIGGLGMLLKRLEDPQSRWIAENMLDAAKRGDKLTKQLLAFSRGKRTELTAVDLHELVRGMEELLRRSIDPEIMLVFSLSPDARWVKSDANQLELAVLNLAINARDAMPGGGRIEIAVKPSKQEGCIDLVVSDNGMGMPREVADRALEPFYTTKPAGKGTGLGLSQVYGAAQQSGGSVDIETAPGRGTSIKLVLPRTEAPARASPPPVEAIVVEARGGGRSILVVDDEPGVRAFMAEALRDAGYNATEAEDVGVALMRLESDPPDLLLTDYSMPGMNGLELAERGRAKAAGLKVLIVSGYADAAVIERSPSRPTLLHKPFDEAALLKAVESVLAA
ncbi:ATP-binding protein [Terricaulis sp.]|uniref:ATP-binding protein n=1 Tax=Terricaulis sp. TaxID=2768686 RepID=UPI00378436CA